MMAFLIGDLNCIHQIGREVICSARGVESEKGTKQDEELLLGEGEEAE